MNLGAPDAAGYVAGTGGDAQGDRLKGIENLRGSAHADTLTGDGTGNVLEGGAGADTLNGGGGVDWLYGGSGNDTLGGAGGYDVLEGGAGADVLRGGEAADRAAYTASSEGVTVNLATGKASGGDAESTRDGVTSYDTLESIRDLEGSEYGDTLTGNGENNWLIGRAGNDTLAGGGGNDELDGGVGADTLSGGTGADTFLFDGDSLPGATGTLAGETDVVEDFSGLGADGVKQASEDGDELDLSDLTEDLEMKPTLTFLATEGAGFTGVKGQVRYEQEDEAGTENDVTHVQVDLDGAADAEGNYAAEFQVTLDGLHTLTAADLILA